MAKPKGTFFIRSGLMSFVFKSYLLTRMKKVTSKFRNLPQLRHFMIGRGFHRADCLFYSPLSDSQNSKQSSSRNQWKDFKEGQCANVTVGSNARHSSSGGRWGRDGRNKFPVKLMDFPERTMPEIVKSFRNTFFAFLIKGYYDSSFSVDGFLEGATQAATYTSSCISEGNFADLKGLVVDEAIQEIQNNYADLTYQQRRWLRITPSELMSKFVYEIGMMFDDDTDQRFVEITVVLHGYHDLENTTSSLTDLYNQMGENPNQFYVCNYRFIREFTKGVEDSWTINKLNHFLPFVPPDDEDSTQM